MWRFLLPQNLSFTLKNFFHSGIDRIAGKPVRPIQAMAYVRDHAQHGNPVDVLAKLDDFATNVRWMMSIGPLKDKVFDEARSLLSGQVKILELGAYAGYSSIYLAQTFGSDVQVTSIEVNPDYVRATRANLEHAGLTDRVTVIEGSSTEVIATLDDTFDLVFLDHWKDLYLGDLQLIEQRGLLRQGSVVVADNVGELFNAEPYLHYVRGCGRYTSENRSATIEYTDMPDAVEISVYQGPA